MQSIDGYPERGSYSRSRINVTSGPRIEVRRGMRTVYISALLASKSGRFFEDRLVLATQQLGDASAGRAGQVGRKAVHDLLDLSRTVTDGRCVYNDVSTHRVARIGRGLQRIGRDLRVIDANGATGSLAIGMRNGQLDRSVSRRENAGVDTTANPRKRDSNSIDRDRLRIGERQGIALSGDPACPVGRKGDARGGSLTQGSYPWGSCP